MNKTILRELVKVAKTQQEILKKLAQDQLSLSDDKLTDMMKTAFHQAADVMSAKLQGTNVLVSGTWKRVDQKTREDAVALAQQMLSSHGLTLDRSGIK